MPIYEFERLECGAVFEVVAMRPIEGAQNETVSRCACGGFARMVMTAPARIEVAPARSRKALPTYA